MRKINVIYVAGLLLIGIMAYLTITVQSESAFFYGFAENKSTEINHINDVLVSKIHVNDGQAVKKGQLLLDVINDEIGLKIDELGFEKEAVSEDSKIKQTVILNKIAEIETEKSTNITKIQNEIFKIQHQIEANAKLYEGLKTIQKSELPSSKSQILIAQLEAQIQTIEKSKNQEIAYQRELLKALKRPTDIKKESLNKELDHLSDIKRKLSIYAPSDGLIGTISCEEGENISAFTKLLDFYKHNPTQVKGYVHESQILEVKVNDKLEVASTLHPDIKVTGVVIGLGSRIVEIPERLRKIPDFKVYGREVLIQIPTNNRFLQKEKVMLNASMNGTKKKFGSIFSDSYKSRESDSENQHATK